MAAAVTGVEVEPDGDGLLVRWEMEGEVAAVDIAVGTTPDAVDHAHAFTVEGGERSARIEGLRSGRHYVSVSPHDGGGALVVAPRRVAFEGVTNFRDLGGYPAAEGTHTRWGRVFRADGLHRFTEDDLIQYEALGFRAVYDLRGDAERDRYPDPFPAVHLPLITQVAADATPPPDSTWTRPLDKAGGERALREIYQRMLADAGPLFGRLFTGLTEADGLPAVFHCTGGKDRTGMSAALLLEALGVPRNLVLDDYELTSRYRLREHQTESYQNLLASGMAPEAAAAVLGAPRWAMAETLQELDDDYGGIEAYLTGPAQMSDTLLARLKAELVG